MLTFPNTLYSGGATRTFIGFATAQVGSGPAYTFSGVTAAQAGYLVLTINGDFNSSGRTLSTVTVGGNSATLHVNQHGDQTLGTSIAAVAGIAVGAGATGNIVITFSNTMTGASYAAYLLTSLSSNTPTATAGNATVGAGGATSISTSINIPANGVLIATASCVQTSISLSGATSDGTQVVNGIYQFITGSDQQMNAETGRSVSSSKGGAASSYAIAAAAWH